MSTIIHVERIEPDLAFPYSDWPAAMWVERLVRDDPDVLCRRVYNPYLTPPIWQAAGNPIYSTSLEPERWSYVIHFSDGSTGVCRVVDFETALAALGYQVDLAP